ncbi:MAG: ArnT family glycosyltransferase [bacterium]
MGRLTTTLFGVFTVLFTYLLAKRFFNERVGIVASFFLAFNLIHVVNSQSISVDVPLTLFVVLSLFFIHSVYERAGFRDYALAGLCIGLGMGIKYTAALLVIPLLVAHFLRKQRSSSIQKRIIDSKIAIGVTTVVFSFILVSPFCLLDFQSFWKDFSIEMRHMAEGHFGQEETATPYLSYLTGPLKKGSGIPVEILALVGLIISLIRRGHNELLFLSFPIGEPLHLRSHSHLHRDAGADGPLLRSALVRRVSLHNSKQLYLWQISKRAEEVSQTEPVLYDVGCILCFNEKVRFHRRPRSSD